MTNARQPSYLPDYGCRITDRTSRRESMRQTLKHIMTEYGAVAVVLYLVIFALVLGGSWVAIRAGWSPSSASGKAGTFAAAYIITKLTQPVRIALTVILTPFVARLYDRVTKSGQG